MQYGRAGAVCHVVHTCSIFFATFFKLDHDLSLQPTARVTYFMPLPDQISQSERLHMQCTVITAGRLSDSVAIVSLEADPLVEWSPD